MEINIRKIGNSKGIIIPKYLIQEMGYPRTVEITSIDGGIFISPTSGKTIRRKPRNEDETDGFYKLMESKIETNIASGKTKWIGNREMERRL